MEKFIIAFYILLFIVTIFFSYIKIKYFITMWKFKNRKKDGSEDKDFKMFD